MLETRARTEAINKAIKKLNKMLANGGTRADIASRLGVNKGLVTYTLQGIYSPTILRALGIPVPELVPVETCTSCGKLHKLAKSCAAGRKAARPRYRKIVEMHSQEEMDALEAIARYNEFDNWKDMCRYLAEESVEGRMPTIS